MLTNDRPKRSRFQSLSLSLCGLLTLTNSLAAQDSEQPQRKQSVSQIQPKTVQVFILLGQSNMLGFGKVDPGRGAAEGTLSNAVQEKGLYSYLIDDQSNWVVRDDVRYVQVMGSGTGGTRVLNNDWLTVNGQKIGPEQGIGHVLGNELDEPVMLLKSCIGNRALGWDLLPPGSEGFEYTDQQGVTWVHPGYKGSPEKWRKGETPEPIDWYAGKQYDGDVARAKAVLAEFSKYYPEANGYQVAGFFWWQGDRDRRSEALSSRYEQNLIHLIKKLRIDFDAPKAKFVCATLGQTEATAPGNERKVLDAMLSLNTIGNQIPEFAGSVGTVYTHPLSKGGNSGSHYNGNAETYMNVGEAMGRKMVELIHRPQ